MTYYFDCDAKDAQFQKKIPVKTKHSPHEENLAKSFIRGRLKDKSMNWEEGKKKIHNQ